MNFEEQIKQSLDNNDPPGETYALWVKARAEQADHPEEIERMIARLYSDYPIKIKGYKIDRSVKPHVLKPLTDDFDTRFRYWNADLINYMFQCPEFIKTLPENYRTNRVPPVVLSNLADEFRKWVKDEITKENRQAIDDGSLPDDFTVNPIYAHPFCQLNLEFTYSMKRYSVEDIRKSIKIPCSVIPANCRVLHSSCYTSPYHKGDPDVVGFAMELQGHDGDRWWEKFFFYSNF